MPEEILPGLYRIKIPLPETPLSSVNSYLIASAERSLLIDTGMNRKECLRQMRSALGKLEVDLNATDFFITHWHIDHLDLVSALVTPSSRIYLNRIEAEALAHGVGRRWQQFVPFARQHGFPDGELEDMLTTHPPKYGPTENLDFSIVGAGDQISVGDYTFVCLETPGHSPGH